MAKHSSDQQSTASAHRSRHQAGRNEQLVRDAEQVKHAIQGAQRGRQQAAAQREQK